jgi:hypothetical protein
MEEEEEAARRPRLPKRKSPKINRGVMPIQRGNSVLPSFGLETRPCLKNGVTGPPAASLPALHSKRTPRPPPRPRFYQSGLLHRIKPASVILRYIEALIRNFPRNLDPRKAGKQSCVYKLYFYTTGCRGLAIRGTRGKRSRLFII